MTELGSTASNMLTQAKLEGCNAYSVTANTNPNISILHQQIRCINLAWALTHTRHVKHGSIVGIVGGSFSGMMMAVCLAIQRRCIIYIYEKESRLLDRFRFSHYRFVDPNLSSRDLPPFYDPATATPIYIPPIFAWTEGSVDEVAHEWLREFQTYYMRLPIFLYRGCEVTAYSNDRNGQNVELQAKAHQLRWKQTVNTVIFATGFGEERKPYPSVRDWSYWRSGSPFQYRPGPRTKKKQRVLISGCGDSGIVEMMHYVFRGFEHRDIFRCYYPKGSGIESHIQPMLEDSHFWKIRYDKTIYEYFDGKAISELCWFYHEKAFRDDDPENARKIRLSNLWPGERRFRNRIEKLYSEIGEYLHQLGVDTHSRLDTDFDKDRLMQQITKVPIDKQLAIRKQFNSLVAEIASLELNGKIDTPKFKRVFVARYRKKLLNGFEVWLNDTTPTPYTEKLSPIMLIFLKLCKGIETVRFISGRLINVKATDKGYEAYFVKAASVAEAMPKPRQNARRKEFDHVATRFGIQQTDTNRKMIVPIQPKIHYDDWLHESPRSYGKTSDLARETLVEASRTFYGTRPPPLSRDSTVSKFAFITLMLQHKDAFEEKEQWLQNRLRRGCRVAFTDTSDFQF
jgi:hypothetical protein